MSEVIDEAGLFWRKTDRDEEDEDIWDDSLLIDAYDRAVQSIHNEISNTSSVATAVEKKPSRNKKKDRATWSVGDKCMALYSGDSLYYDAVVLAVKSRQRMVTIRFEEYGDEADVSFADLLPWETRAEMTPADQEQSDAGQDAACTADNEQHELVEWSCGDACLAPNRAGKYQQAVVNRISDGGSCKLTFISTGEQLEALINDLRPDDGDGDSTDSSSEESASEQEQLAAKAPRKANDTGNINCKPCENPTSHISHGASMPSSAYRNEQTLPNTSHYAPRQPSGLCTSCQHQSVPSAFHAFQPPPSPAHAGHRHEPPPPIIPPPPVLPGDLVRDGMEESLANMLMAWYMSGYHTGYYQGSSRSSHPPQPSHNSYVGQQEQSSSCKSHQHRPCDLHSSEVKVGACRSNSVSN